MPSFLRGHVQAFERLGGVPRVLLYDNLRSAVLERRGDLIHFHPTLLALAAHYRFAPRPCAPARARPALARRRVRDAAEEERVVLLPLPDEPFHASPVDARGSGGRSECTEAVDAGAADGVHASPVDARGSGGGSASTEAVDAGAAVGVHASPVDARGSGGVGWRRRRS